MLKLNPFHSRVLIIFVFTVLVIFGGASLLHGLLN